MNEIHEGLRPYRTLLRDAVDRDLRRRRRTRVAVPALAAAAAAAAAVVAFTGGGHVQSADAAILRHVAAALAPQDGAILHERALVSVAGQPVQVYELWARPDTGAFRVMKFGGEASANGSGFSAYDRESNTITVTPGGGKPIDDPAATVRDMVRSGHARVEDRVVLDGVPAYRLAVSGAADRFQNGTVWVARDTYHPLRIVTTVDGAPGCAASCTETISYQAYEYLPPTDANLALLDVAAQHPGARVVTLPSAGTTTTSK
jgi:hypothetical protein